MSRPLLVFIGPSASGKSQLVGRLVVDGVVRIHPTWTTRPPRRDEDPADAALEHRFVDPERFAELEAQGFFMGTAEMFGLSHRYGLPQLDLRPDGPIDAVMLRAPLVDRLRRLVTDPVVYHIDTDLAQAEERLRARSADEAEAMARIEANAHELELGRSVADRVFANDADLDDLVEQVSRALRVDFGVSSPPASAQPPPPSAGSVALSRPPAAAPSGSGFPWRKVIIAVGIVAAVLLASLVVIGLVMAWSLSQWANNK